MLKPEIDPSFSGVNATFAPTALVATQLADALNIDIDRTAAALTCRAAYVEIGLDRDSAPGIDRGFFQTAAVTPDGSLHVVVKSGTVYSITNAGTRRLTLRPTFTPTGAVWATPVLGGIIVQDGYARPCLVTVDGLTVLPASQDGLTVGTFGTYVQGRYFYVVRPDNAAGAWAVLASDYGKPTSMREAANTNRWGWLSPDGSPITSVSTIKTLITDVEIGGLLFTTERNSYMVDVRGDRSQWSDTAFGRAQIAVPDIGAAGPDCVASSNSEALIRSRHYGLSRMAQRQAEFSQIYSYSDQFYESNAHFEGDAELAECHQLLAHGRKLFATSVRRSHPKTGEWYYDQLLVFDIGNVGGAGYTYLGRWSGLRVLRLIESDRDVYIWAINDAGTHTLHRMKVGGRVDVSQSAVATPIISAALTRGYAYGDVTTAKQSGKATIGVTYGPGEASLHVQAREDAGWATALAWDKPADYTALMESPTFQEALPAREHDGRTPGNYSQFLLKWSGPVRINYVVTEAARVASTVSTPTAQARFHPL